MPYTTLFRSSFWLGQSDVVLHHLAAFAALGSLQPGSVTAVGNRGRELFGGVFACAGDDEGCVIEARTEKELATLRDVVGADLEVDAWPSTRPPHEGMEELPGQIGREQCRGGVCQYVSLQGEAGSSKKTY